MNKKNNNTPKNISARYIYVLGIVAIVGAFFKGGLLEGVGSICLLLIVFSLIKNRKLLSKHNKIFGWCLVIVWAIVNGIVKGV